MTLLLRAGLIRGLACAVIVLGGSYLVGCAASSVASEAPVAESS